MSNNKTMKDHDVISNRSNSRSRDKFSIRNKDKSMNRLGNSAASNRGIVRIHSNNNPNNDKLHSLGSKL